MELIRSVRRRRGLSQRALARRAGLSFRGVQLIESPGHDTRLSSLESVSGALGLPSSGVRQVLAALVAEPPDSLYCASLRVLTGGEPSWKLHLMDAVDAFRREPSAERLATPPVAALSPRLRALFAATADSLAVARGLARPDWTAAVGPLPEPWFVSGYESLKASALVESPLPFRSRNVFVLANFLARA